MREGWKTVEALPCGRWLLVDRWRCGGDGVDGEDIRRGRRIGEERAKWSAESFALVLSLPSPSACSFALPCPYYLKEGKEGKEEDEPEAGRMADRRGAALPFCLLLFFLYI